MTSPQNPFQLGNPNAGLAPNLVPNPPPEIPGAPGVQSATASLSPFSEPQDVDSIIKNLVLDRPLKLFVPNRHLYPDHQFRIINSVPGEMAQALREGWREVTDPAFAGLFEDLVAGTGKDGKAFRPVLMARDKRIGDIVVKSRRKQLAAIYQGMDPKNNEKISGKYVARVDEQQLTQGNFTGDGWRIRY